MAVMHTIKAWLYKKGSRRASREYLAERRERISPSVERGSRRASREDLAERRERISPYADDENPRKSAKICGRIFLSADFWDLRRLIERMKMELINDER
jgi:hypothetical protein